MRLEPLARLLRISNVLTPAADIVAGALLTVLLDGREISPAAWSAGILASVSVYCAGMVFNDYFDFEEDRELRPSRPLPSGQISRRAAGWIGVFLLVLAFSSAALVGTAALGVLAGITILAVSYDASSGRLGPLRITLVPLCRTANVLLGATLAGWPFPGASPILLPYAIGYGGYILIASAFGSMEDRSVVHRRLPVLVAATTALTFVPLLSGWLAISDAGGLRWLVPTFLWLGLSSRVVPAVLLAWREPEPATMGRTVGRVLRGVLLFHGVFCTWLIAQPVPQLLTATAFVVADQVTGMLARRVPPT
ncbi:MAG: UbiA family prenyltransferase [Planctomycetota bacterium]